MDWSLWWLGFAVGLGGVVWLWVILRPSNVSHRLVSLEFVNAKLDNYSDKRKFPILVVRHTSRRLGRTLHTDLTWIERHQSYNTYWVCEETGEQASDDLAKNLEAFVHTEYLRMAQIAAMEEEARIKEVKRRAEIAVELLAKCTPDDYRLKGDILRAAGLYHTPSFAAQYPEKELEAEDRERKARVS